MITFLHKTVRRSIAAVEKKLMDAIAEHHPDGLLGDPMVFTYGDGKVLAEHTAVIADANIRGTLIVEDGCMVSGVIVRENTTVIIKKGSRVVNSLFGDLSGTEVCIEIGENSNIISDQISCAHCSIGSGAVILNSTIKGAAAVMGQDCMLLEAEIECGELRTGRDLLMMHAHLQTGSTDICRFGDSVCIAPHYRTRIDSVNLTALKAVEGVLCNQTAGSIFDNYQIGCRLSAKVISVGSNCLFTTGCKLKAITLLQIGEGTKVTLVEGYQKARDMSSSFWLMSGEIQIGRDNVLIADRYNGDTCTEPGDSPLTRFSCVHTGAGATILCQLQSVSRADMSYANSFSVSKKKRFHGYLHFASVCRLTVRPGSTIVV